MTMLCRSTPSRLHGPTDKQVTITRGPSASRSEQRPGRIFVNGAIPVFLLALALGLLLAGCTPAASPETGFLLEKDFHRMTDAELVAYEQELSDELLRSGRTGASDVGLGVGIGSWGGSTGFGVRADKWFGGGGGGTDPELLARRDEVRNEMKRRGLLQQ